MTGVSVTMNVCRARHFRLLALQKPFFIIDKSIETSTNDTVFFSVFLYFFPIAIYMAILIPVKAFTVSIVVNRQTRHELVNIKINNITQL